MIKQKKFPRIFFGWWTVIGSGVLQFWMAGFHLYGFSALFKPIAADLGFSRAATSVAASIGRFEGGFESPIAGWATDRFGPRWVIIPGIILAGVSLILMNYINSLWAFYLVWGVLLGTGSNLATALPTDIAISNWFVKKRGLALGIKWVLAGLSGAVILPLVAWLITVQGWRMTCVIGGVALLTVGLLIAWFGFKQHRPEYYGLLPDGATAREEAGDTSQTIDRGVKYAAEVEEVEFTLRQALRTPAFWVLIVALAIHSLVQPIISLHSVPFLTDFGFDPIRAAGMLAMLITVGLPLRFVAGFLADRVKKSQLRLLFVGAYLMQTGGFAVFLLNQTIPMIYLWFIIYGIGNGLATGLMAPFWARYFGRKAIGSIRGAANMFMTPVGIAAPVYAGWVYDTTGSYFTAFKAATAVLVLATVLIFVAWPPKPPAVVTDVRKIV